MWIEKETYWILNTEQRSPLWYKARYGRCTTSLLSACLNECSYLRNTSVFDLIKEIKGELKQQQTLAMKHGIFYEDKARKIYEKLTKNKAIQIGLAVPKWNIHLATSTDGIIGEEGILEIKCPLKYYKELEFLEVKNDFRNFINKSHYLQMQGGMAILNRKWCDYVVYYPKYKKIFIYRVPFDQEYWNSKYERIKKFISDNRIDQIEVMMPN